MRRGEIVERFDPHFHLPNFKKLVETIKATGYSSIGNLISFSSEVWNQSPNTFGTEFPYIEISAVDLQNGEYLVNNVLLNEAPSRAKMIARDSDIIVSMTRPNRGAIAKIKAEHDGYIASTGFAIIRETKAIIDRDYLYYSIRSSFALNQFLQRSSGGNYPAITQDEIEKVVIPLPNLDIQRTLVADMESTRLMRQEKLSQADDLLKGIDEFVLEQLELKPPANKLKTVYGVKLSKIKDGKRFDPYFHQEKFSLIAAVTEKLLKLSEFISEIHYGASVSNAYVEDGIPFLRILNLFPGEIKTDKVKCLPEIMRKEIGRAFVHTDDFLISRSGSIGIVAKVPAECDGFAFGSFMIRFVVSNINQEYLEIWLNGLYVQAYLEQNRIGAIQGNITIETIENIPVFLPNEETQKAIVAEYKRRRTQARQLREEAEREWQNAKENFEKALLG